MAVYPGMVAVRNEFSAGGIVTDGQGRLVVIASPSFKGDLRFGLPKGHPRDDESPAQAALREVREETGLTVALRQDSPVGRIDYWFVVPGGQRVHKLVEYFRMDVVDEPRSAHDGEVEEVLFLEAEQASSMLSYENERRLVREVLCG